MRSIVLRLVTLLLGLFFGFVGYHKAFASLADLKTYGSWTVHLPDLLGRAIGWSEMACALLLIGYTIRPHRWVKWGAAVFIVNQLSAAATHWAKGETAALPQNFVLIALLSVLVFAPPEKARSAG